MYASGITFTAVSSVSPAAATILGGNNGLSNSTVTPTFLVLGQNVAQAGNPAILLSNRELPMSGFRYNAFGGQTIFSDTANAGDGVTRLQLFDTLTGTAANPVLAITATWTTTGFADMLTLNLTENNAFGNRHFITCTVNTNTVMQLFENAQFQLTDPANFFLQYFTTTSQSSAGAGGTPQDNSSVLNVNQYSHTSGSGRAADFASKSSISPTGGSINYIGFFSQPFVNIAGTGNARGFLFQPAVIVSLGGGKLIAYENTLGDCYFNSTAPAANAGRTGFQGITTPTAFVHLGPGRAAASSAPLKLTSGTNQTVAEAGAFEYNGTNLFFTRVAATRENVFTGVSGAAAPATSVQLVLITNIYGTNTALLASPTSWASVVVGGTAFKIPLYT